MNWKQLRYLAESKSFWSLNILLIIVPFLARIGWNISYDMALLYVSATLITISTILYNVFKPDIVRFDGCEEYQNLGKLPAQLKNEYESCGFKIADINNNEIKTILEDIASASSIECKSFWYVYETANKSKKYIRFLITALFCLSFLILIGVNGHRFITVMEVTMNQGKTDIQGLKIGVKAKVRYSDGEGKIIDTRGKVISYDDNGYIVLQIDGMELKYVPKKSVVDISHSDKE